MKIKVKDLEITLIKKDAEIIPSIINNLTKESKMFILILASVIIPAYVCLRTHESSIKLNNVENNQLLKGEVINND